jgi:hypothetical protein
MAELLSSVIDAHGGLARWARVERITARVSLGGPFWAVKGRPDAFLDETLVLDPRSGHVVMRPFLAPDRAAVLDV